MVAGMIERVGTAIAKCDIPHGKQTYKDLAKVAIAAMREPSKEMILEGTECCGDHVAAYQAMIDKALQE